MNSVVIYYSISGNTKKIAQAIHQGMTQASEFGEKCDIVKLTDVRKVDLANYDLIGLGSPVMRFREMPHVTQFIECTMEGVDGKHGFAFCTHGAWPAHYMSRVVPAMVQRGLTIVGWNDWFGSVNHHPTIHKPYVTDGHPDETDLQEAEEFGRQMIERSRKIYAGATQLIPAFPRGKDYDDIYDPPELFEALLKRTGETSVMRSRNASAQSVPFVVNFDKCKYPKCHYCIDNCPTRAIDFSVSPPMFNLNCDRCWQCEMTCPTGAIEVDFDPLERLNSGRSSQGGHLPGVLELYSARGRFRMLVSMEDIQAGHGRPSVRNSRKPRYKADH